jgi:hypothetical protein
VLVCVVHDKRWRRHDGQTYCRGFSGAGFESLAIVLPGPGSPHVSAAKEHLLIT